MRSARWPLEALRGVRRREEEVARRVLSDACASERARAVEREASLEVLRARQAARLAGERTVSGGATGAGALAAQARHCSALRAGEEAARAAVGAADQRLAAAQAEVARARGTLVEARRALEVLERHHAAWAAARRRRIEQAEEAAQDDRAATGAAGTQPT